MTDKGQNQGKRCYDDEALVFTAKNGIKSDQDEGEYDDGGPGRLEGLQEKADRIGQAAPEYELDRENQDRGRRQRGETVSHGAPDPCAT
jgi:hypothetical protein